jgi:AcrR family transcriptional regulator
VLHVNDVRRRRVPAMPPEDRRAALVEATVPLLHEHGLDVSTRQIAAAAGVAEGTIFGVFKDKNSLVVAALMQALDPQPTLDAIAAIDPGKDLRRRVAEAADLINERFTTDGRLMSAARGLVHSVGGHHEAAMHMARNRERLQAALTAVIEPDAAVLRRSPGTAARLLLLFAGANAFGPFGLEHLDGAEMASLLLDGLLVITDGDRASVVPLLGKTDKC